jgi:hypothetical protein
VLQPLAQIATSAQRQVRSLERQLHDRAGPHADTSTQTGPLQPLDSMQVHTVAAVAGVGPGESTAGISYEADGDTVDTEAVDDLVEHLKERVRPCAAESLDFAFFIAHR